jgi:hypothetical protein
VVNERLILPDRDFLPPLDAAIEEAIEFLKAAAWIFRGNLESALTVASIPYTMAYSDTLQSRMQSLVTAEKIRALKGVKPDEELSDEQEGEAYGIATVRLHNELADEEATGKFRKEIVRRLHQLIVRGDMSPATDELLLETIVMLWGAFEVFVTEMLKSLINLSPGIAVRLLTGDTKKHFPSKGISIEALAERNFNVVQTMGNILFDDRHLDSLHVMRDVLQAVYLDDEDIRKAILSPNLWLLSQRRHLIVHRRGEVDLAYLSRTGETLNPGARLRITSDYIYESFNEIRDAAIAILRVTTKRFGEPAFCGCAPK